MKRGIIFTTLMIVIIVLTGFVVRDFSTPEWKKYQEKFFKLSLKIAKSNYDDAIKNKKYNDLTTNVNQSGKEREQFNKEFIELEKDVNNSEKQIASIVNNIADLHIAMENYIVKYKVEYNASYQNSIEKVKDTRLKEFIIKEQDLMRQRDNFVSALKGKAVKLNILKLQKAKTEKTGEKTNADEDFWANRMAEIKNSKYEIQQVYNPDLKITDRCITCHLGARDDMYRNQPVPFNVHSGNYLVNHPVEKFGCTVCHGGEGYGTTVKGGHGREHAWQKKLLPLKYVESTCIKCHEDYPVLETKSLTKGRDLFLKIGCFGCHKGMNDIDDDRLSIAPPLSDVKAKIINLKWVKMWLEDPLKYNPDTYHPNFSLTGKEIDGVISFLFSNQPKVKINPVKLNGTSVKKGESLFISRGCMGCHSTRKNDKSIFFNVPNLNGIGSKVSADWLYGWVKDPFFYNKKSRMPKLDIKDDEIKDIVKYLTTLKENEKQLSNIDVKYSSDKNIIEKGKDIFTIYSCFGCHEMTGFEKAISTAPDLALFAGKNIEELSFGFKNIPHTKWDWAFNKLKDPRQFSTPSISLMMGKFPLKDDDIDHLITLILGERNLIFNQEYRIRNNDNSYIVGEAKKIISFYNCQACHVIENDNMKKTRSIRNYLDMGSKYPPILTDAGTRLKPEWLFQFLMKPHIVRSYLEIRMPSFNMTHDTASIISRYLFMISKSKVMKPTDYSETSQIFSKISVDKYERGKNIFELYQCNECHTLYSFYDKKEKQLAPRLSQLAGRLRPEEAVAFLKDPTGFLGRDTYMPSFFYRDDQPIINNADNVISDVVYYLYNLGEKPDVLFLNNKVKGK